MGRWSNSPGRAAMAECGYLMESEAVAIHSNRVLQNTHQAVSQGVRRFGKRCLFS